jgi:hypothetical protein
MIVGEKNICFHTVLKNISPRGHMTREADNNHSSPVFIRSLHCAWLPVYYRFYVEVFWKVRR